MKIEAGYPAALGCRTLALSQFNTFPCMKWNDTLAITWKIFLETLIIQGQQKAPKWRVKTKTNSASLKWMKWIRSNWWNRPFYLVRAHRSNRICALFSVLDSSSSMLSVLRNVQNINKCQCLKTIFVGPIQLIKNIKRKISKVQKWYLTIFQLKEHNVF